MPKEASKNWYLKKLPPLYRAILKLKTVSECYKFFRDLCTLAELRAIAERFEVVQLIVQGVSYRTIARKTGVSTATVTRIAHWLYHGEGGYQIILKRLKNK